MNKFDAKINEILREGIGSFLKSATKAGFEAGHAFSKVAQDPTKAAAYFKGNSPVKDKNAASENSYSLRNKPIRNDKAVISGYPKYKTRVTKDMDTNGKYGLTPYSSNNRDPDFYFIKTVDDSKTWKIVDKTQLKSLQSSGKVSAICPSKTIPFIEINSTDKASTILIGSDKVPLNSWQSEKVYLATQNQINNQKPAPTPPASPATPAPTPPASPATPPAPTPPAPTPPAPTARVPRSPRRP
jgi:hypothetical protein